MLRSIIGVAVFLVASMTLAATPPVVTVPSVTVSENSPSAAIDLFKSKTNSYSKVRVQTVDGTAKAGVDYRPIDQTLTLANSVLKVEQLIPLIDNSTFQGTRSFTVKLTCVRFCTLKSPTATVTITDDELQPASTTWTYCAGEGQDCTIAAPAKVRYGATLNGIDYFITKVVVSPLTVHCGTTAVWGYDPIVGIGKACYTDGTPVFAPVDPNCTQPMTWNGVTACTEIPAAPPPFEEADIADGLPRDLTTIVPIERGGAMNQKVPDDSVGAFRVFGKVSWLGYVDPLAKFGLPSGSHLHVGICNSLPNKENTTYQLLRTTGTSTCGILNRTAIWMPAIEDVVKGVVILPKKVFYYYKQIPAGSPGCTDPVKKRGICVDLPNGHRWIFGFNMNTMVGGPMDINTGDYWLQGYFCGSEDSTIAAKIIATGHYRSLKEVADAGCPVGATLSIVFWGPDCYDGRIDSPDHHAHVSYAMGDDKGYGRVCLPPYNYLMPEMQFNWQFTVTSDMHNWWLSSDLDMQAKGMVVSPGQTLHMDYWEGWAKSEKSRWKLCIQHQLSCASGDLGDGFALVGADGGNDFPEVAPVPIPPRP